LVFELLAQQLRSKLQPVLTLKDAAGSTLVESRPRSGRPDILFGYRFRAAGTYLLQIRDSANASGADVTYRLNIGAFPLVTRVVPLGLESGAETAVQLEGFNLGGRRTVRVRTAAEPVWGKTIAVPLDLPARRDGSRPDAGPAPRGADADGRGPAVSEEEA